SVELCSDSDRRVEGLANVGLGKAYYQRKEYDKAVEYLNRALDISKSFNDRIAQVEELYNLALAEYAKGNLQQALVRAREAVTLIESLRTNVRSPELRASLLAAMQDTYDFYIDLLMRLHKEKPGGKFDAQ